MSNKEYINRVIEISSRDFVCGEDGFYYWWPCPHGRGALDSADLRIIADEMDRRNSKWQKQINEYFEDTSSD